MNRKRPSPNYTGAPDGRRGFALPVVVFLLFAIGVAAAAGFQIVQTDAKMSTYARDAGKALAIAHSGMRRYMASLVPVANLSDTVDFAIDGGEASVSARRVSNVRFPNETWVIRSRGEYGDPATTEGPAERTVLMFAKLRRAPLNLGGVFANTGTITIGGSGVITGNDQATLGQCAGSPQPAIPQKFQPGGGITAQEVLDSLSVHWATLTDPAFPVDYQNTWAPLALPSSVYPVVRFTGNVDVASLGILGFLQRRGVLIVQGQLTIQSPFRWDGVILAGRLATPMGHDSFNLDGLMVGGLSGVPTNVTFNAGTMRYHSCKIMWSGDHLLMFEPKAKTWMEVF